MVKYRETLRQRAMGVSVQNIAYVMEFEELRRSHFPSPPDDMPLSRSWERFEVV